METKSLSDLKQNRVVVAAPAEESFIPKVGGPEGEELKINESEENAKDINEIANEIARSSGSPSDISLDFSEMLGRSTESIEAVVEKINAKKEEEYQEKVADEIIDSEFEEDEDIETLPSYDTEEEISEEEYDYYNNIDASEIEEEKIILEDPAAQTVKEKVVMVSDEALDKKVEDKKQEKAQLPEDFIEKLLSDEESDDDDISDVERDQYRKQVSDDANVILNRLSELMKKSEKAMGENRALTVSKRPVTIDNFLNRKKISSNSHEAEWVLPCKGRKITVSALTGNEIITLDISQSSKSRLQAIRDSYMIIYNHITSEKPKTFEEWIKTEYVEDVNSYYMALYRATFENANHIANMCGECLHAFLTENIPIMDMVKFRDEEAEQRFNDIMEFGNGLDVKPYIETRVVPISDIIAVGLKEPTIYSTIYENQALPEKFRNANADVLNMISYIDAFYIIDGDELRPIAVKHYPNNAAKTTKYKIAAFSQVIKSLTSDEYNKLYTYITQITSNERSIYYQLPELTCPKCGKKLDVDTDENGLSLLFKRHQLVPIVSSWAKLSDF